MIKPRQGLTWTIGILCVFVLATSGCASKKYVNQQISPVNQRLSQYEKQTNDRLAWLHNKEQADISQMNDRIVATDHRLSQVADVVNTAQQANQGTASRSTEEMELTNAANSAVANALNFRLVEKADVTFGFDKATLTPSARSVLDAVVIKFQSEPRGVVELAGFTDPIGSSNYNLGLSRRRAWAVERYLVEHNVPIRSIHIVGMGEDTPPSNLAPVSSANLANLGSKDQYRHERRVNIRVYAAGDLAGATGSGQ
jgi:outer membrane protein OmpA-like peptidoglycan-associated protein